MAEALLLLRRPWTTAYLRDTSPHYPHASCQAQRGTGNRLGQPLMQSRASSWRAGRQRSLQLAFRTAALTAWGMHMLPGTTHACRSTWVTIHPSPASVGRRVARHSRHDVQPHSSRAMGPDPGHARPLHPHSPMATCHCLRRRRARRTRVGPQGKGLCIAAQVRAGMAECARRVPSAGGERRRA